MGPGVPPRPIAWITCAGAKSVPLVPGRKVVVGRDEGCEIRFVDPEVSRRHVVFEVTPDQILAKDQKSANGTFVNSVRIFETVAKIGDVFQVGPFRLESSATERAVPELTAA